MASRREIELGKLATSLGFDLVKVISRGARGEFEQYATYRIYDANTDVLLVPSLEGLDETEAELAYMRRPHMRRPPSGGGRKRPSLAPRLHARGSTARLPCVTRARPFAK
jgi:hypothetical protein